MVGPGDVPRRSSIKDLQPQTSPKTQIEAKGLSASLANQRAKWRPPPDPENESPGAVGTATGAEVQSVPCVTSSRSSYRKIGGRANSTIAVTPDAPPLYIVIVPTANGRKWIARLGERQICRSTTPLVISARLLLGEGYSADTLIEVWRPDADAWAMRGRLGAVAATLLDGETASRSAKNGVPVRFSGKAAPNEGGGS